MIVSADSPIEKSSDDLGKRDEFVSVLVNTITSVPKDQPFTIGLFGEWGSGKTSVINIATEQLKSQNEKIKVIRFDPWIYSDETQLLNQFFRVMAEEFGKDIDNKRLKKISSAFEAYAGASEVLGIIPVVGGYLQRLGDAADFVAEKTKEKADDRNLAKIKDQICEELEKCDKQFLVIIDDIDRLTNEQIRMVFQLVNSIAKFPNIIYLLSFDRTIVSRALEEVQKCDGNDYLEKIIQAPIILPLVEQTILNNHLMQLLVDLLAEHEDYLLDSDRWQNGYFGCIEKRLTNFRDIKRFVNTFSAIFSFLHTEIDFTDLACLVVLQIWEPDLFYWIYQNRKMLCGSKPGQVVIEVAKNSDEKLINEMGEFGPEVSSYYKKVLSFLFPKVNDILSPAMTNDSLNVAGRVAYQKNLELVYHFSLNEGSMPRSFFSKYVFEADFFELKDYLCETANENQIEAFLSYVNGVDVDTIKGRFPVILQVLLLVAGKMDVNEDANPLSVSGNRRLWFTVSDMARAIGVPETEKAIEKALDDFDVRELMAFSHFLRDQILAYGQFENSTEDEAKQFVSLRFLQRLKDYFLSRIRTYSKTENLLERPDFYSLPLQLWKYLDEKECEEYIDRSLQSSDKALVMYTIRNGNVWSEIGSNKRGWSMSEDEDPKFSSDNVLAAIGSYRLEDDFWDLPDYVKERVATFALQKQPLRNEDDRVTLTQARTELRKWRNEYLNLPLKQLEDRLKSIKKSNKD